MTVKLTFFYNQYKQGFSETYYSPTTNPALLVNGLSVQLLTSMTQFRSLSTLLYAIRGTQIETPFRSFTRLVRGAYQGAVQTDPDAEPDVVGTTAVLQLVSEEATKRRLFLRGLPDDYVKRDAFGNDLFIGTFRSEVTKMVAQLIGNGFAVRKQLKPPAGGLAYAPVLLLSTDVDNALRTRVAYTATAGFTPVKGSKIAFKGIDQRDLPRFPRIATVLSVDAIPVLPFLRIDYAMPGGLALIPKSLVMSNLSYAYEAMSEFTFERFSAHKTGSPFGQLAGKKR